jgi:putative spermidine/putrescine transport system substrate-binding protein
MRKLSRALAIVGVLTLVAAACSKSSSTGTGGGAPPTIVPAKVFSTIGTGEGALNLIAWNGYVEDGSNDPNYDWVHPFENKTGCKVTVKYADTSDEMVSLMKQSGVYDGVSASGNATNRLIAGHYVAAVDPTLLPAMSDVIAPLAPGGDKTAHYIVNGYQYGSPYMYGPNFLMYNPTVVKPAPTSWDITFEPTINGQPNPYAGKITAYDDAIFIADAALYLKAHDTSLGITDPYELTPAQLDAAIALLQKQKPMITKYWSLYTDEIDGFESGSMVAGTAWPINLSTIEFDAKVPVKSVIPSEGVTGWADTWMVSTNAPHPNCMLEWMQWTMRPDIQAEVAVWYGAAGSNVKSCPLIKQALGKDAALVNTVRYSYCGSIPFLESLYLWKTPQANCGDSRGNTCADVSAWSDKWIALKGA